MVLVSLIFLNACSVNGLSQHLQEKTTEVIDIENCTIEATDAYNKENSVMSFKNEEIKDFIQYRIYKYDEWIYYSVDNELRKCKPDLTQDILLEQDVYRFYNYIFLD